MGAADAVLGNRGSGCLVVDNVLRGSFAGSPVVWFGDVGYVPIHWEDLGRIPPQGGLRTDGAATVEGTGWDVALPPTYRGNGRSGPIGGG